MIRRLFICALLVLVSFYSQAQQLVLKDSVLAVPSKQYKASDRKETWLGANYRDVWGAEVKVPVLRLSEVYGGLKVEEEGGGMQTKSLQLEDSSGREYSLRSVEKYTEGILPEAFQRTLAADVLQDQISSSHPFASVATGRLAEEVGVYHTNPKIVYVAADTALAKYADNFVGKLALFEERPDDNEWEEYDDFGKPEEIISTDDVRENLRKNSKYSIDQEVLVRARVFDMLIGDWDRHSDQWRWGEHEVKDGDEVRYEAIPRDRDNVFFVNQGIVPNIASRKWIQPKFQGFDEEIRDIEGLFFNARHFDREFANQADKALWIEQAKLMQEQLSDEEIEQAFQDWPKEVYALSAPEIIRKLKARKKDLVRYAEQYYEFLAKNVDIIGTNDKEHFKVERLSDTQTRITVADFNKEGGLKEPHYIRTFDHSETEEVRLYGLEDDDVFELSGEVADGIKIRIIGGKGKDVVKDTSKVAGWGKHLVIYDNKKENNFDAPNARYILSNDTLNNQYNPEEFKYDHLAPVGVAAYNPDDGIFLGAGVLWRTQEFRKAPYAYAHRLAASYAFGSGAYQIDYLFEANDIFKYRYNFSTAIEYNSPSYSSNFFGLGNETTFNKDELEVDYFRTRQEQLDVTPRLAREFGRYHSLALGARYRMIKLEATENRVLTDIFEPASPVFDRKHYGGAFLQYVLDSRDSRFLTLSGVMLTTTLEHVEGLNSTSEDLTRFSGSFAYYKRLGSWPVIIANRTGFAHNFQEAGDYEFFQANYLGGQTNLRGYRRNRFGGDQLLYNNLEARILLFRFWTYIAPGSAGILGFYDVGRVWVDGEESDEWHTGYGSGIFIAPANMISFSFMYGISDEDNYPVVRLGFFF